MFPFVLPWDDAAPGTITDVSFLNAKPAGVNGYIVPKNGHFVESKTGKRVRFLGTNFAAKNAFPSHADAEKSRRPHRQARHQPGPPAPHGQQRLGDRRQHLGLLLTRTASTSDPAQLDKLDYLVAQFKKNGVYSNINLHVSRQFSDADGFPDSVSQIPFDFDKRVDEFDRRMIQLQKNYAHDLLTHVNPYTGLSYAEDPAVAVVEINNENSLVGDPWGDDLGADLDTLPEPFRGELVGFWNDWLAKKYGTDAKVQAAWTAGPDTDRPRPADAVPRRGPLSIRARRRPTFAPAPDASPSAWAAPDIDVHVTQTDGTDWHVQAHQTGLDLHDGAHLHRLVPRQSGHSPRDARRRPVWTKPTGTTSG